MTKPNPLSQGITLANTHGAIQALQSAVNTVDDLKTNAELDPVRKTLDEQLRRYKAELDALTNLYGG